MSFVKAVSSSLHTQAVWQDSRSIVCLNLPLVWRQWLLDRGSLTKHLTAASHGAFRVGILQQRMMRPQLSEQMVLNMPHRGLAMVREVILYGHDQPWVFARSVLPVQTLTGAQRRLRQLDNRPLGALLFADPSMRRGAMQISQINRGQLPSAVGLSAADSSSVSLRSSGLRAADTSLWGRRSVFYLDQKPLLVSEVFLPGFCPYNFCPYNQSPHYKLFSTMRRRKQ